MEWSTVFSVIINILLVLNFICILALVFISRKDPTSALAWLLVLVFLPIIGFVLYMFIGHNSVNRKRFHMSRTVTKELDRIIKNVIEDLQNNSQSLQQNNRRFVELAKMNFVRDKALPTTDNDIRIYTDGNDKFRDLMIDIENAKEYVHLLYFIFETDEVGNKIIDLLAEKSKAGVDVKLVYDDVGNISIRESSFKRLKAAGGRVSRYSPLMKSFVSVNYRNHRKLVIIDGKIGYIGGMNVGIDYIGGNKKITPWRDTHLRIEGSSVYQMEYMFLEDYVYATKEKLNLRQYFNFNNLFTGNKVVQIVASVPDNIHDNIRIGYMKMMQTAENYVYLQSPYFTPDRSMVDSLRIAAYSGVDVRVMIPGISDHYTVYMASLLYAKQMVETGIKVYRYDGFLHSKTLTVDDVVTSIGSANFDSRSLMLSFEANAFIYDEQFAASHRAIFMKDMEKCTELTMDYFNNMNVFNKAMMQICKLIAPLM